MPKDSQTGKQKQPTVFILYIPGGAMLGLIPAITLSRIESLTETPTSELFQVIEGVSTGSILTAGFNMPGRNAKKVAELYVQLGPQIFPDMPGRWAKMNVRNGINVIKYLYDLDPKQADFLSIRLIKQLCNKIRIEEPGIDSLTIDALEAEATARWLTTGKQKNVMVMGEDIVSDAPGLKTCIDDINELVASRTFSSRLGIVFKSAVVGGMDTLKNNWARLDQCLFPSAIPEDIFKKLYGDRKISEGICSTYISAYDIIDNKIVTFSALKDDLFDKTPGAPATVKNDIKFWDATMASSANELAFKAHITETNMLCSDKAILHKPRSVNDVLAKVKPGTRVVLVVAGTGKRSSKDLVRFLDHKHGDDESLSEEQRYRMKLEIIREQRAELGVGGNLALGQELSELEGYITSDAMEDFADKLGKNNIFNFTPRISPRTPQEKDSFPSKDVLDASEENIKKIINRGRKYCEEEDTQIRELSQQLVDNLYLLGRMDAAKYARVCRRIGLKTPDTESDIEKETKGIEDRIASNDNSTGLKRVWRDISRKIFKTTGGGPLPEERDDDNKDDPPDNDGPPPEFRP